LTTLQSLLASLPADAMAVAARQTKSPGRI
jgi:hypothetical protein